MTKHRSKTNAGRIRSLPVSQPPKAKVDKRSAMVWVRMTAKEREAVEVAAQRDGLPASTWMRVVVLKAAAHGGLIGKDSR